MNAENKNDDVNVKGAHRWCFTYNNPPDDVSTDDFIKNLRATYVIYGKEVAPKTGTVHLQGYIEFKSTKNLTTLRKFSGNNIHWEVAKGQPSENHKYCSKDGVFFEAGTISAEKKQGNRSDIKNAIAAIIDGVDEYDLFLLHPEVSVKYGKGLERFRLLNEKKKFREHGFIEKEIIVHWGRTGTGKTSGAIKIHPDAFIVSDGITGFWWDGYDGEKTVIMDEFRGNLPLNQLLRILDGYAVQVSIRGGSKQLLASKIYITSNLPPEEWYKNADIESNAALMRRITTVVHFA